MNAIYQEITDAHVPGISTNRSLRSAIRRIIRNPWALTTVCLIGGAASLGVSAATLTGSQSSFPAAVDLTALLAANGGDGSEGFVVDGATASRVAAAGDVNGDQIDDLIVSGSSNNAAYVVFGTATGSAAEIPVASLDGNNGFAITGLAFASRAVGSAGDINDDGFDDVIAGSPYSNGAYVVFGSDQGLPAAIDVVDLDGNNGFVALAGLYAGTSVAGAGDINGDGIDDIVIGRVYSGQQAYVLFGTDQGFPAQVSLAALDGSDGFALHGGGFQAGGSVGAAGDVNGDQIDDIVVGGSSGSGDAYVVFGTHGGFPAAKDLGALDGSDGFTISGPSGWASSAGDVNGDGIDDVMVADRSTPYGSGRTHVVFGRNTAFPASVDGLSLDGNNGFTLTGPSFQYSSYTASPAGDINGDGIDDISIGGNLSGPSYVVFGTAGGFPADIPLDSLDGVNGFVATGANKNPAHAGDLNADGIDDLVAGTGGFGSAARAYVLFGRSAAADTDADGVVDAQDNCTEVANPGQQDADADNIGNACDTDLNNNCLVTTSDLGLLKAVFFTTDPVADFDSSGFVNAQDLGIMKLYFASPPGPSGLPNDCDGGD